MNLSHSLYLPYPGYVWMVVRKSALMWLLVRLLLFVVILLYPLGLSAALHTPTFGIPVLLVWLDRRLFHEQLLPANLGGSELWLLGVSLVIAVGLDVAAEFLLSLV